MIRNYYTEAYKGGIIPTISATNLIDGTAKVAYSTTSTTNTAITASSALVLATANFDIKVGMIATGTGFPAITATGYPVTILRSSGDGKNFTLSADVTVALNATITYSAINQSSWKEYNLYIANSPSTLPVTTTTDNLIVSTSVNVGLASANPLIKAGMYVKGTGLPAAGIEIASVTSATAYILDSAQSIAANATLTYTYITEASVSVLTADNKTLTFARPAEGFVLPVSVVQVTAATGGVENNLIALE
jgi:hypothetical protein